MVSYHCGSQPGLQLQWSMLSMILHSLASTKLLSRPDLA